MGREFALRQAEDHIGILKEAVATLEAENASLTEKVENDAEKIAALKVNYKVVADQARMGHERHMKLINEHTALKRENKRLRGFLDTVMLNWEEHRVYKALLTAEEQE